MIFEETGLKGAYIIKPERLEDERGFFTRAFCQHEFERHHLNPNLAQCNMSFNKKKGTFRGMHYQMPPYEEDKIVLCPKGGILDIIVDLRVDSPTYKDAVFVELTEENLNMLYVPKSYAHGFLTLEDDTLLFYMMTEFYQPDSARGFRWNDPAFNIKFPQSIEVISERDRDYPDYDELEILKNKKLHEIHD